MGPVTPRPHEEAAECCRSDSSRPRPKRLRIPGATPCARPIRIRDWLKYILQASFVVSHAPPPVRIVHRAAKLTTQHRRKGIIDNPGVRRGAEALVLGLVIGVIVKSAIPAEADGTVVDPHRIEILYSENDALCRPIAGVYDKLSHEHPHALDWEDKYVSQFNAIGLQQPKPVYYHLRPVPTARLEAYYRVPFSGERQKRSIYVEDTWFGNAGGFRTDVWVFKSSIDVPVGQPFNPKGDGSNDFSPDQIDYAMVFSSMYADAAKRYRVIALPYYFRKIASSKQKAAMESEYRVVRSVPSLPSSSAYSIQRPFAFGTSVVILAEDKYEFLVYQLRNDGPDDVCYFITSGYLSAIHNYQ